MARAKVKNLPDLSALVCQGQEITVKVTPNAAQTRLAYKGDVLQAFVSVPPEDGKANLAVTRLLAQALGIAPSRLTLLHGQTSRLKTFRIDDV
ncbi:DUF167 domain-containing protein [Tropicibacter sp. Alg240-R139]|uniref:DUF167 domain-containing protein n=1 Tax=Tropicibacter sp. Alg240-R139 TaxID=2305991 RepID=UPI0013DEBCC1|nr:DUF167 domain-containing protein [Tropicibacter sp. Alg240-R139]